MREATLAMAAAAAEVPPDQLCEAFVSDLPIWLGQYLHYMFATCLFQGKADSFYNDLLAMFFDWVVFSCESRS